MIPDYQTLMRPVLEAAANSEVSNNYVIEKLADEYNLTEEERTELLPSGKQATFSNRVQWAKSYLKQAGLLEYTRRSHFIITDLGKKALLSGETINTAYLKQYDSFREFQARTKPSKGEDEEIDTPLDEISTPDEIIRKAYKQINNALAEEMLEKIRSASPKFFEALIVDLFIAMGYGGATADAGRSLGQTGDNGVDGVIDQDALGVDQVYLQAKRYADANTVGSGAIRDFFGALNIHRAHKGIFVTTSTFSPSAIETAKSLGSRIVLIDGFHLARLMIRYGIGCRTEETFHVKKLDEEYFDPN